MNEKHRACIYIAVPVHRQAKAKASLEGRSLSEVVESLLSSWSSTVLVSPAVASATAPPSARSYSSVTP